MKKVAIDCIEYEQVSVGPRYVDQCIMHLCIFINIMIKIETLTTFHCAVGVANIAIS